MADYEDTPTGAAEAAVLIQLIRARYPGRLTEEQLGEVQRQIASLIEAAQALRAYPLSNADEPATTFQPIGS